MRQVEEINTILIPLFHINNLYFKAGGADYARMFQKIPSRYKLDEPIAEDVYVKVGDVVGLFKMWEEVRQKHCNWYDEEMRED